METKQIFIGAGLLLAFAVVFPIVYTNWPRDPKPEVDLPVLAKFNQAIAQYNREFGMLPRKLDDLKPKYLTEIPLASNREPFKYDPKAGRVTLPYSLTPEKVEFFKNTGVPISSTSPMGEVMTGISIRNELSY